MLWSDRDIDEIKRRAFVIYKHRIQNGEDGDEKQDFFDAEEGLLEELLAKERRDREDNRLDKK
jgi:hypothetical protein